nr:2-hydroxyisoflavanone dehydratase-like [Tanacetum cinerariifolium]
MQSKVMKRVEEVRGIQITYASLTELAPEHPLPIAHSDCWAVFQWIATHANGQGPDSWINDYVDMSRVYLVGESAGANLAHYLAVQAGVNKTGLGICGLITLHPYFAQKEPDNSGSTDDPKLYPGADPDLEKLGCLKVLIVVAEKDFLKPRGIDYKETLEKSKWEGIVEFVENEGEDHCFYLFNPSAEKAKGLMQRPSNPILFQSHFSLDITFSLSPITPIHHLFESPSPPSPPPPQPPIMGHPIYFNILDHYGANCLCCFPNHNLILSLRDEMHFMFSHIEYLLTFAIPSPSPPHP